MDDNLFQNTLERTVFLCIIAHTVTGVKGELKVAAYLKILSWERCFVFFIEGKKLRFLHSNFITSSAGADRAKGRSTVPHFVPSTDGDDQVGI